MPVDQPQIREAAALAQTAADLERELDSYRSTVRALDARCGEYRASLAAMRGAKDAAYRERDHVVALAARMAAVLHWPTWLGQHEDKPGDAPWDADWRNIVFIELPSGQVSWHIHDSELELVRFLPSSRSSVASPWDGHDTAEKYRRCDAPWPWPNEAALASSPAPTDGVGPDGTIIHALAYLLRATYDVEGMSDEQRDVWRALVGRARGEYDRLCAPAPLAAPTTENKEDPHHG